MDKKSMVLFSVSQLKIVSARHFLKEAGIESFVLDKMDSAHAGVFGDIELYVPAADQEKARTVLLEHGMVDAKEEE